MIFFVWSINANDEYVGSYMVNVEDEYEAEALYDIGFGAVASTDPDFIQEDENE
jgi:hypothetical protein